MLAAWAASVAAWEPTALTLAAINLVKQTIEGGVIAYAIVALSVVLVTLSTIHLVHLRWGSQCPEELLEEVVERVHDGQLDSAEELVATDPSALAEVLEVLIRRHRGSESGWKETLADTIAEHHTRMSQRVAYVGLIAALAPMLGLLGTVSGMIQAFATMSASPTTPDAAQLAGAISEALITTYLGLIVAMPALIVHTILKHQVASICFRLGEMGEQFLESLHRLVRGPDGGGGRPTRRKGLQEQGP